MIAVPVSAVTSAECEQTCSKLTLIKSKLRTSCGQERLEKLLFSSVERDIVQAQQLMLNKLLTVLMLLQATDAWH